MADGREVSVGSTDRRESIGRYSDWVWSFVSTGLVAVVTAMPVPAGNEFIYLPLLRKRADPTYLSGDWTFGSGFTEHAVFDFVLSPLVDLVGVETLAWVGRVLSWVLIARLLVALGRRIGVASWVTAIAIAVFLGIGQSMGVGSEFLFSHFEAKAVAWPLFLAALVAAMDEKIGLAAVFAGLTFSFHPAIGMWAGGALMLALLVIPDTRGRALKSAPITVVVAMPGLIPLMSGLFDSSMTAALAEFVALNRIPHHVDPFSFGERGPLVLVLMLAFNFWWAYQNRGRHVARFLGLFQAVLLGVVILGVVARVMGSYQILLYQPFRILPVVAPIIFLVTLAALLIDAWQSRSRAQPGHSTAHVGLISIGGVVLLAMLVLWNPFTRWVEYSERNLTAWQQDSSDYDMALDWVATSTPRDAVIAAPPSREENFYESERAQLVSWDAVPYDRPAEWIERLDLAVADIEVLREGNITESLLLDGYARVTADEWVESADLYGVTHVVTTAEYAAHPIYSGEQWNVYEVGDLRG